MNKLNTEVSKINYYSKDKYIFMDLSYIKPSQLYISSKKLNNVLKWFNPKDYNSYEPIPIKKLDGKLIFTDGHTRAYAAYLKGVKTIKVYFDEDELDWNLYRICVNWCSLENINSIKDLKNRIVSEKDYEVLWIKRCESLIF